MKTPRITPEITSHLFDRQIGCWLLAADNYLVLDDALYEAKEILFGDRFWEVGKFIVPYRKTSLSADPSTAIQGLRPCFLCKDARPSEQLSLEWRDYEILINPYPLTIPHYTIVSKIHTPQLISGHITDLVKATRIFENACVFYNGPYCGASAPDHLHFQAVDGYCFNNIYQGLDYGKEVARNGKSRIIIPQRNMYAAPYILIDLNTDSELLPLFDKIISALPPADPEPMMNIAAIKTKKGVLIAVFPRRKHRPDCYGTGDGQLLVSPASIEMLGTFPCASSKELDALDETTIQKIYDEVCVSPEEFSEIIERIRQ